MTTKDKTGDQLMASIRKTKTEAATTDKETAGTPQAATGTQQTATAKAKPAAVGTPATRPRATKKKVAAKHKAAQSGPGTARTGYQSPGRVWPD